MLDDDHAPVDPPRPRAGADLWRQRWDDLRARRLPWQLAIGAAVVVAAVIAALVVLRPAGASPGVEATLPMVSTTTSVAKGATTTAGPSQLVVHLVGGVARPGVYAVPPGTRVNELVALGGGLTPDADASRVNLAAPLRDGEQVVVPRIGEPSPPPSAPGDTAPIGPVDLNTATAAQLEALPGIGPATAKAIVDERERNGPFSSVDDLLRVRGIGPAKLDQIRELVTV